MGEAGRLSALQFEGNTSFDRERLVSALKIDFEVQAAAHPLEPLSNYLAVLEKKILAGYRREGFPEAAAHSGLATNGSSILVRIAEGPRVRCAGLNVKGLAPDQQTAVSQKLEGALADFRPGEFDSVIWATNSRAPFDSQAQEVLTRRVAATMAELGYFGPKFKLKVIRRTEGGLADLDIDFENPGTTAVLKEIEITGLFQNNRPQVLDFLKLKPGMPIQPGVASEVIEKLEKTGRFFRHEAQLSPPDEAGQFKLALKLDEVEMATPLDRPLTPTEEALAKFGERVRHWDAQAEDWVFVLDLPLAHSRVQAELVLSSAGAAAVVRTAVTNRAAAIKAAAIVAGRRLALYSLGTQRKLILEPQRGVIPVALNVPPPENPFAGPIQNIQVSAQPYFTMESPKLFDLKVGVPPVCFVYAAHYYDSKLEGDQLTLTGRGGPGQSPFSLKLDLRSGRLLSAAYPFAGGLVRLTTEEAGFARLVNEITAAGVVCSNLFDSSPGLAPLVSNGQPVDREASLLLEPEVLQDLNALLGAADSKSHWSQTRSQFAAAGAAVGKLRTLLGTKSPAEVLEPIKRFWSSIEHLQGEDSFHIPPGQLPGRSPTQQSTAPLAAALLVEADQLFPRGSWPWTAARETILTLEGANRHTAEAIQQLRQSEDIGPVGCAVLAALLSKTGTTEARLFARKGLTLLTPEDFRRDYDCLLRTNTVTGDLLRNVLGLFKTLTPQQTAALAAGDRSGQDRFTQALAETLRAAPDSSPESAWPVFERHWTNVVRPLLEAGVSACLPKVKALTNNLALVERGKELLADRSRSRAAREEMAECFTKAAQQGDAQAQYYLGCYYDQELHDPKTALLWFEKAARQDYPHTGCRLGDVYSQGEKVPQDLDRATEWYRREAEHECAWSQYRLGRILMEGGNNTDGLSWCRRAAESGLLQACSALGEYYSDDLFNTPDYVEAYVWLRIAASHNDVPAEVSLRRIRKKLNAAQVIDACKRGVLVAEKIDAHARKTQPKENQK